MAIYKSSFNQKPEKEPKEVKVKEKKVKEIKEKQPKIKKKANLPLIFLCVFGLIFVGCILPFNFARNFLFGLFGLIIVGASLVGVVISTLFLLKKKFYANKKYIAYLVSIVFIVTIIFHLILTSKLPTTSYGLFLKETYLAKTTAGGLLFSLFTYPMTKLLTTPGAYVVSAIALAIFVGLLVDYIVVERNISSVEKKSKFNFDDIEDFEMEEEKPIEIKQEKKEPVVDSKRLAKQKLGLEKTESTIISSSMPTYDVNLQQAKPLSKREYILTPLDPVIPAENDIFEDNTAGYYNTRRKPAMPQPMREELSQETRLKQREEFNKTYVEQEEIKPIQSEPVYEEKVETYEPSPEAEQVEENYDDVIMDDGEDLSEYETAFETDTEIEEDREADEIPDSIEEINEYEDEDTEEEDEGAEEIAVDLDNGEYKDEYSYERDDDGLGSTVDTEVVRPSVDISKFNLPNVVSKSLVEEPEQKVEPQKLEIPPYVAPPVELLNYLENPIRISDDELQNNIERLEQVLEDFKVPAKVNNVQVGPAVTRYELTMPRGISVNKIAQMADDIAMTLASNGAIRVEAPIPGKNSVGIEVPNAQVSPVSLRELIDSEAFRSRGNPLSFVLGKDINGDIIFCNLDKMPHMLVAGSTGSGKSVCLNTMLLSLCYKSGPQDLRLILVDPKMVEFTQYNGLPHLLIPEVITSKDMTINALDWAIKEMDRRYAMFAKNRVVNINEFNRSEIVKSGKEQKIPFIVIVVDELADLMLEAKREIDDRINKLAAKARAAGIHLVLATQRPSVDVITGTVKANLPSRIAFALTNYMDSKTILDGSGAEKLLGKGDMLFKPQDKPEPNRVQGAYVSSSEIYNVIEFIKNNNRPVYDDNAGRAIKNPHQDRVQMNESNARDNTEFDPVLKDALKWFIQMKQASGSMITRRYSVGFNRAGRIMDQMERAGFIGQQEGSKPRQVLITMDEYKAIFGDEE